MHWIASDDITTVSVTIVSQTQMAYHDQAIICYISRATDTICHVIYYRQLLMTDHFWAIKLKFPFTQYEWANTSSL